MPRILAIDYGLKRTGLAVTDPLQLIANPLTTVPTAELLDFLIDYVKKEDVSLFVIGMPKRLDNTPSQTAMNVKGFIKALQREIPNMPVEEIDERYTSVMAMDAMIAGGMKKKDRRDKANVDKVSAAIILQSYMESRK
ncbi:MAG TPA: Holliday junction resolvase RuvX [Cytophagaceae bacterium]|jgi:putative Holliday junction resolvase|nr:Holliday junction resolvase RuvX [Cytophagaceae bacterium]